MRTGAAAALVLLVALAPVTGAARRVALAAPASRAQALPDYRASASLAPGRVRLGETVRYHGLVVLPRGTPLQWHPPSSGGAITWDRLRAWRSAPASGARAGRPRPPLDTVHVETTLQVFVTGAVTIPGLAFRLGRDPQAPLGRLPIVGLVILPVIPPADTSAQLHAVRGPLAAPWWERVPWSRVVVGLLALAALVALVVALRRRRRALKGPAPAAAPAVDPAVRALAELATLRGLHLPEQGRFGEHAFHLTRIVRRFLEEIAGAPRPADTTAEAGVRLADSALGPEVADRVTALLRGWDLLKFARAQASAVEATRAESEVEALIRRHAGSRPPGAERVA